MGKFVEDHVEEAALEWLGELGWTIAHGPDVSPDSQQPLRAAYQDVVLIDRLRDAVGRLNPRFLLIRAKRPFGAFWRARRHRW